MIDSHAHLTSDKFKDDIEQVISRAKDGGLDFIVCQSTSLENTRKVLELSKKYTDFIYPTIGIHPEDIAEIFLSDKNNRSNEFIDNYTWNLKSLIKENRGEIKFVAVGEIGLDYFMFKIDPKVSILTEDEKLELIEYQKYFFEKQLEFSIESNLPVVIHSREFTEVHKMFEKNKSLNDIVDIIKKVEKSTSKRVKAVFHCWTYQDIDLVKSLLDKGYFVSFTNIICYPKNIELLNLALYVNKNYPKQIMLETDCPYLPPANKRGERDEPLYVSYVYEKFPLSKNQIDLNTRSFFNIISSKSPQI